MAILPSGPNGGFSGKAGSVVGYYLRGQWIIRSLPRLSSKNKVGSANQNVCRSKFKKMEYFLLPILPYIRVGFKLDAIRNANSAHNSAKSWNMLNAFHENGDINHSAFRFTSGDLTVAEDVAVEVVDNELIFSWRDNSDEGTSTGFGDKRDQDQVMVLVYNPENNLVLGPLSGARRSAGREVVKVPLSTPPLEYHTWISFIADNRQRIANSVYAGMVSV